jgi:hypothetical protein
MSAIDMQTKDALLRHGLTEFWFSNPHVGAEGRTDLPEPMRFSAEFLSGEHVALAHAIDLLSVHLPGDCRLHIRFYDEAESHGMIGLQQGSVFVHGVRIAGTNNWRLIEFGACRPEETAQ